MKTVTEIKREIRGLKLGIENVEHNRNQVKDGATLQSYNNTMRILVERKQALEWVLS